jgi:hypothetical protein
MAEKSIRACGLHFRLGVSCLDVDAGCNRMLAPRTALCCHPGPLRYTANQPLDTRGSCHISLVYRRATSG